IFGNPDFTELLIARWSGFKDLLFSLIKSSYKFSFAIACVGALLGVFSFLYTEKKEKKIILQILFSAFLVLFILLFAVSVNLVVMEPRWSPRSLIGFAFVFLLLFYAVLQLPKKFRLAGYFTFLPLLFY